ncbi:MAG: NUDIX domain-containing protein [Phycisphaerales bacterium]
MGNKTKIEVIARGVLIHNARVLMCRNIKHGYCYLPGGHVEFGEPASKALERELLEETGLASSAGPMVLTTEQHFDDGKKIHHEINLVFLVEQLGPSPTPPESVPSIEDDIDFVWIDLAQVPEADIRPQEIRAWLMSGGVHDPEHGPWISGFSAPESRRQGTQS